MPPTSRPSTLTDTAIDSALRAAADAALPFALVIERTADLVPVVLSHSFRALFGPLAKERLADNAFAWRQAATGPANFTENLALLRRDCTQTIDGTVELSDGRSFEFRTLPIDDGALRVWTFIDVTDRIRARRAHARAEAKYRSIFDRAVEGIYQTSPEGYYLSVNPALAQIYGYDSPTDLMSNVVDIAQQLYVDADDRERFRQIMNRNGVVRDFEARIRRKDGATIWIRENAHCVRDRKGHVVQYEGMVEDITDRKRAHHEIHRLAHFDPLTELPNRRRTVDALGEALTEAGGAPDRVAVLFIDLDRFKYINDSFGHEAGDLVLRQAASRLRKSVRWDDLVGRLGGDEFVVVLKDLENPEAGSVVAEKILASFAGPFRIDNGDFFIQPSIGIAYHPRDGADAEALIRAADLAMYHAKQSSQQAYAFYDGAMDARFRRRSTLDQALRCALERAELHLVYQPQVDIATGAVVGVEALLRWTHETLGMIGPDDFIPIAEENRLIGPIGRWVLGEACRQMAAWDAEGLGIPTIGVNISTEQLEEDDFIDAVKASLAQSGLAPARLELELTESVMAKDQARMEAVLHRLKALGVLLSLDDFGTGYSSLSYLARLPLDAVKIDRGFVRNVDRAPNDDAVIAAVAGLARTLGYEVIAEGVETARQAAKLREKGCRLCQGYYFSRPLPADAITALLRRGPIRPQARERSDQTESFDR